MGWQLPLILCLILRLTSSDYGVAGGAEKNKLLCSKLPGIRLIEITPSIHPPACL